MLDKSTLCSFSKRQFFYVATWISLSYLISLISIVLDCLVNNIEHTSLVSQLSIMCIVALASAIRILNSSLEEHEKSFYIVSCIVIIILLSLSGATFPTLIKKYSLAFSFLAFFIICALSFVLFFILIRKSKDYPDDEKKTQAMIQEIEHGAEEARTAFSAVSSTMEQDDV